MSDFEEKFEEVGALWPTQSKKGWSGSLKKGIPAGQRILVFPNKSDNSKHPTHKIYIPKDAVAPKEPEPGDEQVPF